MNGCAKKTGAAWLGNRGPRSRSEDGRPAIGLPTTGCPASCEQCPGREAKRKGKSSDQHGPPWDELSVNGMWKSPRASGYRISTAVPRRWEKRDEGLAG